MSKGEKIGIEYSQVILPVLTLAIFTVQFFTGFFVPAEIQVAVLYLINMVSRMAVGRDIFGDIKPIVAQKYNIQTKKLTQTKTFWVLVIGLVAVAAQVIGSRWGLQIDIMKYSVPILSIIGFVVGLITRQPVEFKGDAK